MKRDIVCLLRITIDSLPEKIRNSKFLFSIARLFFKVPTNLFDFRKQYKLGKINDLSKYYLTKGKNYLKKVSKETDINSFHLKIIKKKINILSPDSLLDVGCGEGFLLNQIIIRDSEIKLLGIDYQVPKLKNEKIEFIEGDILDSLKNISENSFEFVICTHVIEHLKDSYEVLKELRRVCSKVLIIICPLEKEYRWGLNYHINFYPDIKSFLAFLHHKFNIREKLSLRYEFHVCFGDAMYIQYF